MDAEGGLRRHLGVPARCRRCHRAQPLVIQVDGKEFHYFLSHKKEHSKHGSVPGHVALNLHDSLQLLGFRGWCVPYPEPDPE